MPKSKVLFVELGSAWGGQEIYSQNLIHNMVKEGYQITHVSSQSNHKREGIIFLKVQYHWYNFYSNSVLINKLVYNNDIIIFNGNRAIQLSYFIRKVIPFCGIKHGPFSVSNFGFLGNLFLKHFYSKLFKKLNKLICVAKITYDECVQLAGEKVVFLSNGVIGPKIDREVLFLQNSCLNLVYCGRLVEDKGIMVILNAVSLLHKIKPFSFNLNIFGSGPLDQQVSTFIKVNNLGEVIFFNGFINDHDTIYSLNKPSVMLFASKFEGMPLSILEAYSYGIPVVAYRAPGVSDILS